MRCMIPESMAMIALYSDRSPLTNLHVVAAGQSDGDHSCGSLLYLQFVTLEYVHHVRDGIISFSMSSSYSSSGPDKDAAESCDAVCTQLSFRIDLSQLRRSGGVNRKSSRSDDC
jgi:hypothetical protein